MLLARDGLHALYLCQQAERIFSSPTFWDHFENSIVEVVSLVSEVIQVCESDNEIAFSFSSLWRLQVTFV